MFATFTPTVDAQFEARKNTGRSTTWAVGTVKKVWKNGVYEAELDVIGGRSLSVTFNPEGRERGAGMRPWFACSFADGETPASFVARHRMEENARRAEAQAEAERQEQERLALLAAAKERNAHIFQHITPSGDLSVGNGVSKVEANGEVLYVVPIIGRGGDAKTLVFVPYREEAYRYGEIGEQWIVRPGVKEAGPGRGFGSSSGVSADTIADAVAAFCVSW